MKLERAILICERRNSIEPFALANPATAKGTCSCAVAKKRGATHDKKLGVFLYIYNVTSML
jgi:hypothetical protein